LEEGPQPAFGHEPHIQADSPDGPLVHAMFSYLFGAVIVALVINVFASLLHELD
jgi:hypothetical protein